VKRRELFEIKKRGPDVTTFIMIMNFADQGAHAIKDASKRTEAARHLGKKVGGQIKQFYVTDRDIPCE
jgi:uncharacterized protein with GYD domain